MASDAEIERWRGLFWVVTSYFVALVVGLVAVHVAPTSDPLWLGFRADVAATFAIFVFSFAFQNSSVYDPYWSVAPIVIVGGWLLRSGEGGDPLRQALMFACFAFWGVRLTANWLRTWTGLHHEDWRYAQLQRQTGLLYWPVSLVGIHLFPTLLVFLGLWPAYAAVRAETPFNALDVVAAVVMMGAALLEAVSDAQMHSFRATATPDQVMQTGLWRWSRHPNYLGEIGVWWGVWLFALAGGGGNVVTVVGPLAMVALFRFISIPMMEKRMVERRPAYQQVLDTVPMLLPVPGLRGRGGSAGAS